MALGSDTMEYLTMSTGDVDLFFDDFMLQHQPEWNIPENGAVLVLIPSNRPRPPPKASIFNALLKSSITSYQASKVTVGGCYAISSRSVERDYLWMQGTTEAVSQPANLSVPELVQLMDSGHEFGEQQENSKANEKGRRFEAAIDTFPILARDISLRSAANRADCRFVANALINVATWGGIQTTRRCWADLKMIHWNHRGAPYNWIVVPPTEKLAFETRICNELGLSEDGLCGQFVQHLRLWIDPQQLSSWGIKYQIKVQEERTLFIVFPGTYYWGYGTGLSVIESKYYGGSDWISENYPFCDAVNDLCRASHRSIAPLTIMAPTGEEDQLGKAELINGKLVKRSSEGTITYASAFNKPTDPMKQQPVDQMFSPQNPTTRKRKRASLQPEYGSPMKPQAASKLLDMLEEARDRPYSLEYRHAFNERYEEVKFLFSSEVQAFVMNPDDSPIPESCWNKPSEPKVHQKFTQNTDPDDCCDFCAKFNDGILMRCATCCIQSCHSCCFLKDDVHKLEDDMHNLAWLLYYQD